MREVQSGEDRIKLSSIDRGFIGSRPLLNLQFYERMLDPEQLYQCILTTMEVLPTFSAKIVKDEAGEYWLQHVERYFNFEVVEMRLHRDLVSADRIVLRELEGLVDDAPTALERPVTSVRLVRLPQGCALALSFSHSVADAETLKLFGLTLIAAIYQMELPTFSKQRSFPFERRRREPVVPRREAPSYLQHPYRSSHPPRQGQVEWLQLSADFVEQQLAQLRQAGFECTSHDVIAAWLIKNHAHSLLAPKQQINIRIPINVRPLSTQLEPTYLGNGFVDCLLTWPVEEVEALGLGDIAQAIRRTLERAKSPAYLDERLFLDEHGLNYSRFGAEDKQGFDPESDVIITSVGEVAQFLDLGAGPPTRFLNCPAVPLAFVVEKHEGGYLISKFSARETAPAGRK